jgi:hypothetical protein
MPQVELSLGDWLSLCEDLCEAERRLASTAARDRHLDAVLRGTVDRLRDEVQAVLQSVRSEHAMSRS